MTQSITERVQPPLTTDAFVLFIINKSRLGMVAFYADVLSLATF